MKWYVRKDETEIGPLAFDQVVEQYRRGLLQADTLAWREGQADWKPLWQVVALPPPQPPVIDRASRTAPRWHKLCLRCQAVGPARRVFPGSFLITLLLLLVGCLPGLIYEIWRNTSARIVCRNCGSTDLVPVDSERARGFVQVAEQAAQSSAGLRALGRATVRVAVAPVHAARWFWRQLKAP